MRILRGVDRWIRRHSKRLGPILYAGSNVFCPICDQYFRKFRAAGRGKNRRENAVCYTCKSRERDRLVYKFLQDKFTVLSQTHLTLLHFAPEPSLESTLDQLASGYRITADLVRRDVSVQLDIQRLPFADESFHAIYCSHVLQDIPDDQAALRELFRILKPHGWALILFPLRGTKTHTVPYQSGRRTKEDAPVMLRVYGTEIEQTIREIGFKLTRITVASELNDAQLKDWVVDEDRAGGVYFLKK